METTVVINFLTCSLSTFFKEVKIQVMLIFAHETEIGVSEEDTIFYLIINTR